jgi:hypothetical protein
MPFRIGAGLYLVVVSVGLTQAPGREDLPVLDKVSEHHRLTPGQVARLETALISNPGDLSARTRLLAHYLQQEVAPPRITHILWVLTNRPESKLAGSPFVRVTPDSNSLTTRSDYEAVRTRWLRNLERHQNSAAVLGNAALFFEEEEPERAGGLFERSWSLDRENRMRRAALVSFYIRTLARCESGDKSCPSPAWVLRVRSELKLLTVR